MLKVEVALEQNSLGELSVVTKQPIKKGDVIWEFTPRFDIEINTKEVEALPEIQKAFVKDHGVEDKKRRKFLLLADYAAFLGDDEENFNADEDETGDLIVATADIAEGEEIVCKTAKEPVVAKPAPVEAAAEKGEDVVSDDASGKEEVASDVTSENSGAIEESK